MNNELILSCKIGKFFFKKGTNPVHAKLIRDTVMGQYLSPKVGEMRLADEKDCYKFIRDHDSAIIATIPFALELSK